MLFSSFFSFACLISLAIRRPMLIGSSKINVVYGEPFMKIFVPATILAENSNALNCAFSSYTPSIQNGPFIPGGTSFADAFTKFSPIAYTLSNNDSRNTSGLFAITLNDVDFSILS